MNTRKAAPKRKRATKPDNRVLVLRTCAADLSSSYGFVWPEKGVAECKDWEPTAECGHGLHGLLWGVGDGSLLDWSAGAKWLVVAVNESDIVDLRGKVKFPRGEVVFCGDRLGATAFIAAHPSSKGNIVGGTATAGDGGTATAGDGGTATAGYGGTATAGDRGTATAGDGGTATAGYGGTATAGDRGTATAGVGGTATAGYRGELVIRWYDEEAQRYRRALAYVGEGGIKANVKYHLNDKHEFVEAQP